MNRSVNGDRNGSRGAPQALREWLAVLSVASGAFAFVMSEFLPIGILPSLASDLTVTTGVAGLMITMPGLVAAAAAPAVIIGARRFDRRAVLLMLTAIMLASNILAAVTTQFATMIVARALFGVALGGFWPLALTVGGRLVASDSSTGHGSDLGGRFDCNHCSYSPGDIHCRDVFLASRLRRGGNFGAGHM